MAADQPIFVPATNDFSDAETKEIIDTIFSGVKADELKHKNLSRKVAHQKRIVELVRVAASDPKRVATWVAHKEYAAVLMEMNIAKIYLRPGSTSLSWTTFGRAKTLPPRPLERRVGMETSR